MFLKLLNQNHKRINLQTTSEFKFLKEHFELLHIYKISYKYATPLELINSNIVLRGLLNKIQVEKGLLEFESAHFDTLSFMTYVEKRKMINFDIHQYTDDMPQFVDRESNQTIIIPFFEPFINQRYIDDISIFTLKQHSSYFYSFNQHMLDPYKTYGYQVYKSPFTKLEMLYENSHMILFYYDDFKCIYAFKKDKLKLTRTIHIIDQYSTKTDIDIDDIKEAARLYADFKFKELLELLHDKEYVSDKTYKYIYKKCGRRGIR